MRATPRAPPDAWRGPSDCSDKSRTSQCSSRASRVAIEASIKDHTLFLFGEITTRARINSPKIAKDILVRIGYDDPAWGLSIERLQIVEAISMQSAEIAFGVDGDVIGAGD